MTSPSIEPCPRPDAPDELAEIPLVTIAWRILRQQYRRRHKQRGMQNAERDGLLTVLANIHRDLYKFDLEARNASHKDCGAILARLISQLEKSLSDAGIELVAPVGEPHTENLMEILESKARFTGDVDRVMIAGVIEPAILYRGEPIMIGKIVTEVPVQSTGQGDADRAEPPEATAHDDEAVDERNPESE